MKVHATEGKSIQTVYTHKGLEFWIVADFWNDRKDYNVIYKVGLNNSWFCTPYDQAGYGMGKHIIPGTGDAEQNIRSQIETIKEAAAESHMYAVWNMMNHRDKWNSNGNENGAMELDSFPKHTTIEGTHRLIIIDGDKCVPHEVPDNYVSVTRYFCYLYGEDSSAEIWATSIGNERGYIKISEMAHPHGTKPEDELFAHIRLNSEATYLMRGSELAIYIPKESDREYLRWEYSHEPIRLYSDRMPQNSDFNS